MSNLAAELFRIENSPALQACIPPFLSFLKWTVRAGEEQDALKRAFKAWFTRAQKPAKLIDGELDDDLSPEEMEPMLSERIEKWSEALRSEGVAEGLRKGKADGRAEGLRIAAENLLKKGSTVQEVSEITGLSEDDVLNIQASLLAERTQ